MKKLLAKQTIWSYLLAASVLLLVVGFIVFLVNSTTGYLASDGPSPLVTALSVIALVAGVGLVAAGEKLGKFAGIGYLLVAAMVAISIAGIAWSVEAVVGDIYFIPVNHPESEDSAWSLAIVSLVFYALSFLAATVACFGDKFYKKAED